MVLTQPSVSKAQSIEESYPVIKIKLQSHCNYSTMFIIIIQFNTYVYKEKLQPRTTDISKINDDSIDKQVLQGTPQSCRRRGRPRNIWKREMWTASFRFSWRKMETTSQDRAGKR